MQPLASEKERDTAQAQRESPEVSAGLLSTLTFSWLTPLLKAGYAGTLSKEQVPQLPPDDRVDQVAQDFEGYWRQELEKEQGRTAGGAASLGWACWRTVSHLFLGALPFKVRRSGKL